MSTERSIFGSTVAELEKALTLLRDHGARDDTRIYINGNLISTAVLMQECDVTMRPPRIFEHPKKAIKAYTGDELAIELLCR